MSNLERSCRKFVKRHGEALFIIAFLLADCFLSGWPLTIGTIAVLIYFLLPAALTLRTLDWKGRIAYLKAFVKTPKLQRLAFILAWIYPIRFLLSSSISAKLFVNREPQEPSLTNSLLMGAHTFAPLSYLATPLLIFAGVCAVAILVRSRLKATNDDPDLIKQRQIWSGATQLSLYGAFIAGIFSITLNADGPAKMISNWLLASARDANFFGYIAGWPNNREWPTTFNHAVDPTGIFTSLTCLPWFDAFTITVLFLFAFMMLAQPMLRLTSFLTSFCWRVVSPTSLQNIIEGFLEALRLNERTLEFSESTPFWSNALRTLAWLIACYLGLFWLFGFCGGPIGYGIQSWMITSAVDARLGDYMAAPQYMFEPNFRIFLASVVALYATPAFAISGCVILPFAKARKITLNCDGISFFQGPYFSLLGRQTRLWSDLKSMKLAKSEKPKAQAKPEFTLHFRSGGSVKFDSSQIPAQDLRVLLEAIDQYAVACSIDPEIFAVCQALEDNAEEQAASDGIEDTAIASISKQEFKSTVFVPFSPGEFLPNTKTRIIKQLASKPLCAVYLARDVDGKMSIVKQFYLADETAETKAFAKILQREYEILSKLDHQGIAKVSTSFTVEHSTFLVIEHRPGNDLRDIVQEHGPRSESLTINWAEQLCEIMMYLHGRDPVVLHRDLTPDNVIAGEDGQLRLIDFGAAREFLEGITGTMIGKQCYVAPEQLRGDATQRSDIYSFGCTLYYLLTGRDPKALTQSSPAKDTDCSEELDKLVRDCTSFNQDERPQSFEEILGRLKNLDKGFWIKMASAKVEVRA